MEIELKHLRYYENLRGMDTYTGRATTLVGIDSTKKEPLIIQAKKVYNTGTRKLYEFKPFLHPLFDLMKDKWQTEFGMRLFSTEIKKYILSGEMNSIPFWVVQKLFEWDFDVFNLIENGLAIDINTLK